MPNSKRTSVPAAGLIALCLCAPALGQPTGDPERGRILFEGCNSCHDVGVGAVHKTGPHLNAMFGRPAGQIEGYPSSLPMTAAGLRGLIWDDETLAAYLQDPLGVVPNSRMPLIGVFDEQDRADIIAYLRIATSPEETREARPQPKTY